jgi:hypothetical protein
MTRNHQIAATIRTLIGALFLYSVPGCTGSSSPSAQMSKAPAQPNPIVDGTGEQHGLRRLNLSAIRPLLTHDLTRQQARNLFGAPYGGTCVSGNLYETWLLDDDDHLATAFSFDEQSRLLRAAVMSPSGEIIEPVFEYPRHHNGTPLNAGHP